MNKYVIYTVIIDDYDELQEIDFNNNKIDFICFTNNRKIISKTWQVRYIENYHNLDSTRLNRKYKILPHKFLNEYEFSFYIDGNIKILQDPIDLFEKYNKLNWTLAMFKHPRGNCLYEEAEECMRYKKDSPETLQKQIQKYRKLNIPENLGLVEANVIFRKHNKLNIIKAMEDWWNELVNYSKRDQVSFNYVMFKNKIHYNLLEGNSRGENPYFYAVKHNSEKHNYSLVWSLFSNLFNISNEHRLFEKDIYIFGTGDLGRALNSILKTRGFKVKGFLTFTGISSKSIDNTFVYSKLEVNNAVILTTILGLHDKEIILELINLYGEKNDVFTWRDLVYKINFLWDEQNI